MQIYFKYILSLIFSKKLTRRSGGFTLLELIVVMTIAMIVMTSLVVQQSQWNDQLAVNTQSYEIVLMIRQAQVYSLGVRESATGSGNFDIGYGVHFDSANFTGYVYFVDSNKNQKYDSGEEIETKTFTRGITISKICGIKNGNENCSNPLDKIDISFFRPEPKANISFIKTNGNPAPNFSPPATIYLQSSSGKTSFVKIESNGQVSMP